MELIVFSSPLKTRLNSLSYELDMLMLILASVLEVYYDKIK